MAVTMQQIADLAGVSRGTVDRALNDRGRIRPEVAEKIKMIAKELGYQPNIAAKALSSGNQILRIGVILQYADTPTIQTVLEGAKDAKQEVENYLATEGAHNYFDMNEAMVLGTYKNVKHHIEVFNCK